MLRLRHLIPAAVLLLVVLALTGCTSVRFDFTPNPIVIKPGDTSVQGTVTLSASGIGSLSVSEVKWAVYNDQGQIIKQDTVKVNVTVPVIAGISHSEKVSIPVTYQEAVDNHVKKVVVQVTGSQPGELMIDVQVQ